MTNIGYIGDVGSGKSLGLAREMIKRKRIAFTNFSTLIPNVIRLKKHDIICPVFDDKGKISEYKVNWEFWDNAKEKFKHFDIYLDEVHKEAIL